VICQINKSDIWLQVDKNEKNLPDGADMQKNQKQILELFISTIDVPPGVPGVSKEAPGPTKFKFGGLVRWCVFLTIFFFNFDSFLTFLQFRVHNSAPNLQI
jgi:hypothetical protein